MSQRQTLAIIEALLRDEAVGLRARVESLSTTLPNAPTGNPGPLSADFEFWRGALPGVIRPSTRGNVMLRPVRWVTNTRIGNDVREGTAQVEIGFETTSASHEDNVNEAMLVADALARCLDGLYDYAEANKTTYGLVIVGIPERGIDISLGDFEGVVTYGFLARITIQEYSLTD
jgi:hypothetical protein